MNKNLLTFALGLTTAALGKKVLESKTAKKISVNAVASGIKIKDSFDKTIENIKANTDDIVAEAREIVEQEEREKRAEELIDDFETEEVSCEVNDEEA